MIADGHRQPAGSILQAAERIADNEPVDWGEVERTAGSDDVRRTLRELKALAELAARHRHWQDQDPSGRLDPRRWGHLEIIDRIGEGVYGEVYRARDTRLDHVVALKLLKRDPALLCRSDSELIEEARLLARVRHGNVALVHGADRHDGRVGIWMEYVPGRTLEQLVRDHGAVGPYEALIWGREICRALAAIHHRGVVHRDVKASNVIREADSGRIVLMDLGAGSELVEDDARGVELAGAPLYMAPETLLNGETTARSDLYSLGVLLYHLVTGRYPVAGRNLRELRDAHARGELKLLADVRPDLPAAFLQVVGRALDPDPERRYASAGEFEKMLSEALGGDDIAPPTDGWRPRLPRVLRAGLRPLPAAITAAIIVGAILFLWQDPFEWSGRYRVESALYRTTGSHTARVGSGDRLRLGDGLFLEFRASRDLHVYVLSYDEEGEDFLLYPRAPYDFGRELAGGQLHRLPPAGPNGEPWVWRSTSEGGTEHVVVIASPDRLSGFEKAALQLTTAPSGGEQPGYTLLDEGLKTTLFRGLGGLGLQTPAAAAASRGGLAALIAELDEVRGDAESARGLWIRKIELDYPSP